MNDRVLNIVTYKAHSSICFAGTLRNEKRFELLQDVFILSHEKMYKCRVIGINLTLEDNPAYDYTLEIPQELIQKKENADYVDPINKKGTVSLRCDKIFTTIEEAKESALRLVKNHYELNCSTIENFFNQYLENE